LGFANLSDLESTPSRTSPFTLPYPTRATVSAALASFLPYVPACRAGAYWHTGWPAHAKPQNTLGGAGGLSTSQYKGKTQPARISPELSWFRRGAHQPPSNWRQSPLHLPAALCAGVLTLDPRRLSPTENGDEVEEIGREDWEESCWHVITS